MDTICFDKNGEPLKVQFKIINGVMSAAYLFEIFNSDSEDAFVSFKGNNSNPDDDCYVLPLPIMENDGRIVQLNINFKGIDLNMSTQYSLGFEIYQGNVLLGTFLKKGELSQIEQNAFIMIKLKSK